MIQLLNDPTQIWEVPIVWSLSILNFFLVTRKKKHIKTYSSFVYSKCFDK